MSPFCCIINLYLRGNLDKEKKMGKKPDKKIIDTIEKVKGTNGKIIPIHGDWIFEDEVVTDEEIASMTDEEREYYEKFKADAVTFREDIYADICALSKAFALIKDSVTNMAKERKSSDIHSMLGDLLFTNLAIEYELLVQALKNPTKDPQNWNSKNMSNLKDVLLRSESIFNIKVGNAYWIETMPFKDVDHSTPNIVMQKMSLIFPGFQYHRMKELLDKQNAGKARAKAEKERMKAERAKMLQPTPKVPNPPKEKEKTYKDYWKGLSREEQLAEISRVFTVFDQYCERMNSVVCKLNNTGDKRFAEAGKILENNIIQRFYFSPIEDTNSKSKLGAADYVLLDERGGYIRDENGNICLDQNMMTDKAIDGFFRKFENISHECYKLNDLVGDVKLTNEEFTY